MVDSEYSVSCVQISRIESTRVLNNRAIEFRMRGGETYINILPNRCPGLSSNRPFMYETSISRLCDLDLIRPLETGLGGMRPVGACGLGKFQPMVTGGAPIFDDDED